MRVVGGLLSPLRVLLHPLGGFLGAVDLPLRLVGGLLCPVHGLVQPRHVRRDPASALGATGPFALTFPFAFALLLAQPGGLALLLALEFGLLAGALAVPLGAFAGSLALALGLGLLALALALPDPLGPVPGPLSLAKGTSPVQVPLPPADGSWLIA